MAKGMEIGMAKGMEIGIEKGIAKGMEKEKLATAHRLLSMGLSDEQVSTVTELPTGGNPEIEGTSLKLAELSGTQMQDMRRFY